MLTIAYLGPEKTNTHVAAQKRFGRRAIYLHAPTVDDVFQMVEREQADYGVVPVENSLEGAVTHTLDRFIDFQHSPVQIHGEIEQQIRHHLIVHRRTKNLSRLKEVYSHPQALAQCRHWLDKNLPYAIKRETNSTAEAVNALLNPFVTTTIYSTVFAGGPTKTITGPRPSERAAIARIELVKKRKLRGVPIPDDRENKTRFSILGLNEPKRGRRNKTSILFALKDRPGALYDALTHFKRGRINLTKIESRPSKRKAWEYLFFIDVEGHQSEPHVKKALTSLARSTSLLRVLGSYPVSR